MQQSIRRPAPIDGWHMLDLSGLGGAIAGLLGGVTVVILSPIVGRLNGIEWNLLASPDTGAIAIHLATSIALGMIFGFVYRGVLRLPTDFGLPIYAGAAYGMLSFALAAVGVLPAIDPTLRESSAGMGYLMLQQVMFGVSLGLFYLCIRPAPYSGFALRDVVTPPRRSSMNRLVVHGRIDQSSSYDLNNF